MADDPKADPTQAVAPDPGQAGADGTQQAGGDQGVKAAGAADPSQEGLTAEPGAGPAESVWQQKWNADHGELTKVQGERNTLREEKEALERDRTELQRRLEAAEAARAATPPPAPAPRLTESPEGETDPVVRALWADLETVRYEPGSLYETRKAEYEARLNKEGKSLFGPYTPPRIADTPPVQPTQQAIPVDQLDAMIDQRVAQRLERQRQTETTQAATISGGLSMLRQEFPLNDQTGQHWLDDEVTLPANAPSDLQGLKLSRGQVINEFMRRSGCPSAEEAWQRVDPLGYRKACGRREMAAEIAEFERQRAAAGLPASAPMVPVAQQRGSEQANAEAVRMTDGMGSLTRPDD